MPYDNTTIGIIFVGKNAGIRHVFIINKEIAQSRNSSRWGQVELVIALFLGVLFAELANSAHINSREKRRIARCWRERGVPPLKAQRSPFVARTTHHSYFNERDSTVERSVFGTSFLARRDDGPDSGLGRRSSLQQVLPGAGLPGASASWRAIGFFAPRFKGAPDEPGTPGRNPKWGEDEFDGNGSSLASFRAAAEEPQKKTQATLGLGLAKGKPVWSRTWAGSAADPPPRNSGTNHDRSGGWPVGRAVPMLRGCS
jgi:hypothetical protein